MSSSPQDSKAAKIEDANSDSAEDGVSRAHRGGLYMQNPHQSVIAQTLKNEQGVNFISHASSVQTPGQSIYAREVKIQGGVRYKTETHFRGTDDSAITEWLSNHSLSGFEGKQEENTLIARRGPAGTGKWLLDSQEFINWRDGEARTLWCYGIPGAGKTILASIIINHIHTSIKSMDNNVACIYVYFDYKTQAQIQKRQDVSNLLSSLLGQLVRQGGQITSETKSIYKVRKSMDLYPNPEDYLRMLKSQIESFSKVFIVIDALDECLNDSEMNTQEEFLKALRQLPRKAHVLFTSRQDISIGKKVQADSELEIRADANDLRRYLKYRIKNREHLTKLIEEGVRKNKSFLSNALDDIIERSQGMFLLAQLHIDFLASRDTLEDFEKGILNLPQDLDEVYRSALERIEHQRDFLRKLAMDVLTWLVFAERPLTISELIHALAVRLGDKTLRKNRIVSSEIWTSACAGIVVIDQGTETIRLAHYTAEKYLRDNESTIFKDAQSTMAEICLLYISFEEFGLVPASPKEVETRRQAYPFYSYAANHWGNHVSFGVRGNTYKLAYKFLSDAPKVMGTFQVMNDYRFRHEEGVTGLHVAAYFGLDKLAEKLLTLEKVKKQFELNAITSGGETALHWAAFYCHRRFLELLIVKGADLNIRDGNGRTALHKAIFKEDVSLVETLLSLGRRRINPNLEDWSSQRWTALRWAAAYGQISTVELLLKSEAEVDAQDKDGWTALRWAAQRGHKKIVELLMRKGASVKMRSGDRWSLLEWAAREGRDRFIQLLIDRHVKLNDSDSDGWTALRWAIEYGHGMAAWLLIRADADINQPDKEGIAPLHSAADKWTESRNKSLLWLLLENGADINARTKLGFTALHFAATRGHGSVVWLLLEKASEINAQTKLGLTSLHIAATHGHISVASLLLERGADTSRVDNNRRTALHCAVIEGHEPVVVMLLQKAEGLISVTDDEKRTALHEAASAGNLSVLMLLLKHTGRAEINVLDRGGNTPLHCAVSQQHQHLVACLVTRNADVNIPNRKGWAPLHSAAYSGNIRIIETLLRRKDLETKARNNAGQTPWELAKHCGHVIAKF